MTARGHLRLAGGTGAGDPPVPPDDREDDPKAIFLQAMALNPPAVEVVIVVQDAENYIHVISTCATYNDDIALLEKGKRLSLDLDSGQGEDDVAG